MRASGMLVALGIALAGCAQAPQSASQPPVGPAPGGNAPGTVSPPPPPEAITVAELDTASPAERSAAAQVPVSSSETRLGTTIASLGTVTDHGFWAETGLVDRVTSGRLEYPAAGTSVKVELRPSGGAPGAGTRVSLSAWQTLKVPLTALPELVVYGG